QSLAVVFLDSFCPLVKVINLLARVFGRSDLMRYVITSGSRCVVEKLIRNLHHLRFLQERIAYVYTLVKQYFGILCFGSCLSIGQRDDHALVSAILLEDTDTVEA